MDNKDVEKKLRKSVKKIKKRKFSEVWKEIEPNLEIRKKKGFAFKRWLPLIATSLCLIIGLSVILPLTLHKKEEPVYFLDSLSIASVEEDDFYAELQKAGLNCVDFSKYVIESCALLQTQDLKTKGGVLDALDDVDAPTMLLSVEFFSFSVRFREELYADYNLFYSVNGAEINYKLSNHLEEDGVETYEYLIKAEFREIIYLINYVSFSENVTEFFDQFFQ